MMSKLVSFVRDRIAGTGMRLMGRLGLTNKIEETLAGRPDFFRDYLVTQLQKASDEGLDRMIADCEAGNFANEDVARIYTALKGSGVDVLQELKNEKFLREHRKKHGKVPE